MSKCHLLMLTRHTIQFLSKFYVLTFFRSSFRVVYMTLWSPQEAMPAYQRLVLLREAIHGRRQHPAVAQTTPPRAKEFPPLRPPSPLHPYGPPERPSPVPESVRRGAGGRAGWGQHRPLPPSPSIFSRSRPGWLFLFFPLFSPRPRPPS